MSNNYEDTNPDDYDGYCHGTSYWDDCRCRVPELEKQLAAYKKQCTQPITMACLDKQNDAIVELKKRLAESEKRLFSLADRKTWESLKDNIVQMLDENKYPEVVLLLTEEIKRLNNKLALYQKPCPDCGGEGRIPTISYPIEWTECPRCPRCLGTGTVPRVLLPEDFWNDFRILHGLCQNTIDIYKPRDIGMQHSKEKIMEQLEKTEIWMESIINKWNAIPIAGTNTRELEVSE